MKADKSIAIYRSIMWLAVDPVFCEASSRYSPDSECIRIVISEANPLYFPVNDKE